MEASAPSGALALRNREREERMARMRMKREQEANEAADKEREGKRKVPAGPVAAAAVPNGAAQKDATERALNIPEGWLECPPFGEPLEGLIPSKVPLGAAFAERMDPRHHFTPAIAVERLRRLGREVALVIDLTNTNRYYKAQEWSNLGVRHLKIACKGRNETPDAETVNEFVFEVSKFVYQQMEARQHGKTPKYCLVHCTHGHNRTGYTICQYLARTMGGSVESVVKRFAAARPPGIYKEQYLIDLYTAFHESRYREFPCPPLPGWKHNEDDGGDGDDDVKEVRFAVLIGIVAVAEVSLKQDKPESSSPRELTNDDLLGQGIPVEMQLDMQRAVCNALKDPARNLSFPGSQPVSLDRTNLPFLEKKYYYATWKADGTRYMMLLQRDGVYLIDRSFNIRRSQMRFPLKDAPAVPGQWPKVHHMTLLDGEMVIDTNPETKLKERRYLVYDLMMLNGRPVAELPFSERWKMIEKEAVGPRKLDMQRVKYDYQAEPFRVRRKDFYPLISTQKLLNKLIPGLSHEADGLIFQAWEDPYVPRTCHALLKWKYAHMNSVDFQLEMGPDKSIKLLLMQRGRQGGLRQLPNAKLVFPGGEDASTYNGAIIECAWRPTDQSWEYMRTRKDKNTPNAWSTYEKVVGSIKDNITEAELLGFIDKVNKSARYQEIYKRERIA
eukprot:jgi/Chlat1/4422/Chrsp29S04391